MRNYDFIKIYIYGTVRRQKCRSEESAVFRAKLIQEQRHRYRRRMGFYHTHLTEDTHYSVNSDVLLIDSEYTNDL